MRNLFIALLVILPFATSAFGQGYVDILPDEVKNPFIERHKIIEAQLSATPVDQWAGFYNREIAPTWSEMLVWEPTKGFAAFRDTCSNGPRAWVNYGSASFRDGVLFFSPERSQKDEFVLELPATEFTPVRWGDQHWLVPSDELALFAYAINSRSGDPYKIAYLKLDDGEKRRDGRPELPAQYRALLGLRPIKAKLVEIGEKTGDWFPAMTIDVGKNKGVISGMSFWLIGQKD